MKTDFENNPFLSIILNSTSKKKIYINEYKGFYFCFFLTCIRVRKLIYINNILKIFTSNC